jgi:hypothetical protein
MTKPENIFASVIITAFGFGILAGPVAGYFIDKATGRTMPYARLAEGEGPTAS